MTVALQAAALTLSGLNLLMDVPDPTQGWRIHALGDDLTLGDPEAVIAAIQSQLQDGDVERQDRYGNREARIKLRIDAPASETPGDAVARAQAALDAACRFDGWTELVWTSPMAGAPTSVYEVTSASVSALFDDLAEMLEGCRYVTLSLHARPFARPAEPLTIDAPTAVGSTTTTVDSGSSTTGWSMLSTAPAPFHNRMPNPSFETDTAGWAAGSGTSSIARGTAPAPSYVGSSHLRASAPGTSGTSYVNSPAFAVAAGERLRISYAINGDTDVLSGGYIFRFYSDAAGTVQVGSDISANHGASLWWARKPIVAPAAPGGAIRMRVFVRAAYGNSFTPGFTWGLDGVCATEYVPEVDPGYFDGSTTDTVAVTYTWDGPANNSTSTATWTAPALAVVSGAVQGTVYGRASASIRRTGAVSMTALPYMRIRGTASAFSDGQVTVADDGAAITPTSYTYNQTTGAYDILIKRPAGFAAVDVTFARTGGAVSTTSGVFVAVDQIDITDNPFATGKVQSRQVTIYGSQRTELSLSVLGLDAAGTTPVGLGEQVLVYTAAAGTDGRAKFLACRAASGLSGTPDAANTSGAYNNLDTTAGPTNFTFAAATLLPGTYLAVARGYVNSAGDKTLYYRAYVDPTAGDNVYDPPGGSTWKTAPITVSTAGWPAIAPSTSGMVPLGLLRLPPADLEDSGATLTIQLAADALSAFLVDDVFLLNTDVGQASILLTGLASGSYSAVRLDAATVEASQASAWLGVADGTLVADPARWIGEQHSAEPGLLQIATVTPGCVTSRVSAEYYPRFHTHVATVDAA